MAEFVTVQTDQAVATIRLERPPMNALNAQVQNEIAAASSSRCARISGWRARARGPASRRSCSA